MALIRKKDFLSIYIDCNNKNIINANGDIIISIENPLRNILNECSMIFYTYVFPTIYKISRPHHHIETKFISKDMTNGFITLNSSFIENHGYQRNLQMQGTELDVALLDLLSSVGGSLIYEESKRSQDIEIDFRSKQNINGHISICKDKNIIFYSNIRTIRLVQALAVQLLKLHNINKDLNITIKTKSGKIVLSPISAIFGKTRVKNKSRCHMTGKVIAFSRDGINIEYKFIETGTTKALQLITDNPDFIKILDRASRHKDNLGIYYSPITWKNRGRREPIRKIKLLFIITKTREEREELNKEIYKFFTEDPDPH